MDEFACNCSPTPPPVIVAEARRVLSTDRRCDGRATWVTPVLYSRCRDGRVFALKQAAGDLSATARRELAALDELAQVYRERLEAIAKYPPPFQQYLEPEREHVLAQLENLAGRRQPLLGETARVFSASATAGGRASCKVTLRTREAGEIWEVKLTLEYPADRLTLRACSPGAQLPDLKPYLLTNTPGRAEVLFRTDAATPSRPPGEYELGVLEFELSTSTPAGVVDVRVTEAAVRRSARPSPLRGLNGVLFVQAAGTQAQNTT